MAGPQQSSPVPLTWKRRLLQDEGCYRELLPQLRNNQVLDIKLSQENGGKKINSPEWQRGVKHKSPTPITLNPGKFHTGPETLSKRIFYPTKLAENLKIPHLF
ncbi:hypothetical protein DV515_00014266 [Chloebia gouldiae]|uniref:Uncharacterized protein n=1 Tax=Chloebia gouldiae TaxID=44316 RepID=A0A3L8RYM9_CHLGU|nr:hypothetical protein DV515_00014266 [Chloebia gouldiae]